MLDMQLVTKYFVQHYIHRVTHTMNVLTTESDLLSVHSSWFVRTTITGYLLRGWSPMASGVTVSGRSMCRLCFL